MGGFTEVLLKNTSEENIAQANESLTRAGLRKDIRFYSEKSVELEYEFFVKDDGHYPPHLFPRDKINNLNDFKRYWNTSSLGAVFCPPFGALTFDCYFGRTSKRAMRILGKWIVENIDLIAEVHGSFTTFMERGMTAKEIKKLKESNLKL